MMTRPTSAALAVLAAASLVLSAGVASARSMSAPSAVPRQALGHPGNPVVVRSGAFQVRGPAGSIVHVRLHDRLVAPQARDLVDDQVISSSKAWGAFVLASEGHVLTVAAVSQAFLCGDQRCPNALTSQVSGVDLPAGDYVLALAGPAGSTITAKLTGDDVTAAPPTLTTYPQPFVARDLPELVRTADQGGRGGWATPPLGHRTLAVALAGMRNGGGGNGFYETDTCPGGYAPRASRRAASGVGCAGGYTAQFTSGSISNENETGLPIPLPDQVVLQGWAKFDVSSAMSTQEGYTGAAWAAHCDNSNCTYHGAGFAVLLDA